MKSTLVSCFMLKHVICPTHICGKLVMSQGNGM